MSCGCVYCALFFAQALPAFNAILPLGELALLESGNTDIFLISSMLLLQDLALLDRRVAEASRGEDGKTETGLLNQFSQSK